MLITRGISTTNRHDMLIGRERLQTNNDLKEPTTTNIVTIQFPLHGNLLRTPQMASFAKPFAGSGTFWKPRWKLRLLSFCGCGSPWQLPRNTHSYHWKVAGQWYSKCTGLNLFNVPHFFPKGKHPPLQPKNYVSPPRTGQNFYKTQTKCGIHTNHAGRNCLLWSRHKVTMKGGRSSKTPATARILREM